MTSLGFKKTGGTTSTPVLQKSYGRGFSCRFIYSSEDSTWRGHFEYKSKHNDEPICSDEVTGNSLKECVQNFIYKDDEFTDFCEKAELECDGWGEKNVLNKIEPGINAALEELQTLS